MKLTLEPLTAEAFAPYGDVLAAPAEPGRVYNDAAWRNLRPRARPSLSFSHKTPAALPITSHLMERHEFSAQSFIPMDGGVCIVVVAPHAATGGPDMARARAFLAAPGQGVTYAPDIWHHPFTVLDRPASYAVAMWLDGSQDEEFVTVPEFVIDRP
ncbi:MAG TPA: ureidoglycolate lyase [Roseomonas sp.]